MSNENSSKVRKIKLKRLKDNKDSNKKNNLPSIRKASELTIEFPENNLLEEKEKNKIKNAVINGGIVTGEGKCYLNKKQLKDVLVTDKAGANRVYNNAQAKDKYENGKDKYLSLAEIKKNIEERIEEPRTTLVHEQLKYAEKGLDSFRDAKELQDERHIEADRINKERPRITREKIKQDNIKECELTGEKFENDARGHHIDRVEDQPRKARDLSNITVVKDKVHKDIHKQGADSKEELKKYIKEKGYNTPNNLK